MKHPKYIWGFRLELGYELRNDRSLWRNLFHYKGGMILTRFGVFCFWPHGEITILGLTIAGGLYLSKKSI